MAQESLFVKRENPTTGMTVIDKSMAMETDPIRVAVIGAGNVGSDLVVKIGRSPRLRCTRVIGRRSTCAGLRRAEKMGVPISDKGADALKEHADEYDLVFDATDSGSHKRHWELLEPLGKTVFDLTPSAIGRMMVPAVSDQIPAGTRNISLISCGGQASVPVVARLCALFPEVASVRVLARVAAQSVGGSGYTDVEPFGRTTTAALRVFSGLADASAKAVILNTKPAQTFHLTVQLSGVSPDPGLLRQTMREVSEAVRAYAPGFEIVEATPSPEGIRVEIEVTSSGDRLPAYAGNLDIINAAAVRLAERTRVSPSEPVMPVAKSEMQPCSS